MGVVDIKSFWKSLKFSWLRRLVNTRAQWPKILEIATENIVGHQISSSEIVQLGPNMLNQIGKKFKNKFWKEVFCSVTSYMQGAIFCNPEKILVAPFWDNPTITRNNKPIRKTAFPAVSCKINTISDFYRPGSVIKLSKDELEDTFGVEISDEVFIELHYIIKTVFRSLGMRDICSVATFLPSQPLLINIANSTKKGCNVYTRLLRKKNNLSRNLSSRESKWHTELQRTFGALFWDRTYSLAASIKNENKMKWIQFQINRNCIFTNYKVNKFKPHISPNCTFCSHQEGVTHLELVSHLFWDCDFVLTLWQGVKGWLATFNINIPLDRNKMLFGIHEFSSDSIENYIILCTKYFIWKSKFQTKDLSLDSFQSFLKLKLNDMKNSFIFEEREDKFSKWILIHNCLLSKEVCTGTMEAPLPTEQVAPAIAAQVVLVTAAQVVPVAAAQVAPATAALVTPTEVPRIPAVGAINPTLPPPATTPTLTEAA